MLWGTVVAAGRNVIAWPIAYILRMFPACIALVRSGLQGTPFVSWFVNGFHSYAPAIINCHCIGLTISGSAARSGVSDHPVDGLVIGSMSDCLTILVFCQQVQPVFQKPEQSLTGTAQFPHFIEHRLDSFLHAPVRIFLQRVTVQSILHLYEADRCRDNQFPSFRLGITGNQ